MNIIYGDNLLFNCEFVSPVPLDITFLTLHLHQKNVYLFN